jgi:hypothetical protein
MLTILLNIPLKLDSAKLFGLDDSGNASAVGWLRVSLNVMLVAALTVMLCCWWVCCAVDVSDCFWILVLTPLYSSVAGQ